MLCQGVEFCWSLIRCVDVFSLRLVMRAWRWFYRDVDAGVGGGGGGGVGGGGVTEAE